jgi:hypothetical protein
MTLKVPLTGNAAGANRYFSMLTRHRQDHEKSIDICNKGGAAVVQ